jgi:hypothetical protein
MQDVPIEREIADDTLEPCVLLLELFEPPQLGDPEVGVLPLPDIEGRLAPLTPICRHTSETGIPESACRSVNAICSSV